VLRDIYEEDHRMFRQAFRTFLEREVMPYHAQWERDGQVSREVWLKAGEQGFLGMNVPEAYGGPGITDFRFNNIIQEECARVGASGLGFGIHTDIIAPYLIDFGTEEQKKRYLPGTVTGECILAVAMTEPNTGSDLAGVRTSAARTGDGWILNGQKTFISNGMMADLVIVVARTDPKEKHAAFTLLLVDRGAPGFEPPRKLAKVGMHAQDTAELFFRDVKLGMDAMLGEENRGFYHLMKMLPQERLSVAALGIAGAEAVLEETIKYCKERTAFGKSIGTFQNSRFKLAEMKTEIEIGRVFLNHCTLEHNAGRLSTETASMAKWWCTEMQKRVVDTCVQLHGGYGYMLEYPVARAFIDTRAQTIYAGSTEIMKEIIGRTMGF
jgi:alkylation response protein AidB-like acyl-CoA dehydrogenase